MLTAARLLGATRATLVNYATSGDANGEWDQVVLPMAAGVAPWLSVWAAVGLATVMQLAIGYHVRRRESPAAPAILFAPAVFVVFGRFSQWR
jgi:hypothetical protein